MDIKILKQKAGLAPYERRLSLHQVGNGYRALCKWHNDKKPSLCFYFKDGVWLWRCFPCDKGGDVISFVELFDGIDFKKALEVIATECGISPPSHEESQSFAFNKDAAIAALKENRTALEYLQSRGISQEVAERAGVGLVDYPGLGLSLSIPYSDAIIKFRTVGPTTDKVKKFRHLPGQGSSDLIYGLGVLDSSEFQFNPDLYVVESELDSLTMRSFGLSAVSVSSATSCLDFSGSLKFSREDVRKLDSAERIFIATDMDEPGQKCADAFEKVLPTYKTYRIRWPYGGKGSTDPKDIGEIYAQSPDDFRKRMQELCDEALYRKPHLVSVDADDFLAETIPPREVLLETIERKSPILYGQSLNQLYGWRGTGKTNIALGMAWALATGGTFLRWHAPKPIKTLYVEGELPASQMQERLNQIVGKTNGNLRLITLDKQPDHEIPSLATSLGQSLLEDQLRDAKLIFLDSISTLFNIATNDEENWLQIQNWFKKLRSKGYALLFLHHAGKGGLQRGSSKSEDLLDISIRLSRPENYSITEGLRCVVEFDKTRGTAILDGEPLEVKMEVRDNRADWLSTAVGFNEYATARELYSSGATVREVARAVGVSTGKSQKLRKRWEESVVSTKSAASVHVN